MGGAKSQPENPNAGKPFFFLASCPPDSMQNAIEVTHRYGGFRCIGNDMASTSFSSKAPFAAWKVKAESQFMTLKQLSPAGQKVFGIAIAGFGQTNDERHFLGQLHRKHGHDQFALKQCGDVDDMERWLLSQGYLPVPGGFSPSGGTFGEGITEGPPDGDSGARRLAREAWVSSKAEGAWANAAGAAEGAEHRHWRDDAPQQGGWASVFGTQRPEDSQRATRERLLADLYRAVEESRDVDAGSVEEVRAMQQRISACLRLAADADAIGDELSEAEVRLQELSRLARDAERARRGCCRRLCCCCCDLCAQPAADHEEVAALLLPEDGPSPGQELAGEVPGGKAWARAGVVDGLLCPGTKCRYHSATWGTYISTEVARFNPEDGTYDLLVRQHAKVANISPDPSATQCWPPGTLVEYQSSSAHGRLPGVVRSFNPPTAGGSDGTYNLDIRENAPADRIRLRLPT